MKTIFYRNVRDKTLQENAKLRVGSWIHLEEPTDAELQDLQETFKLDEGLLKDALDLYEVPRMEVEDKIIYIFSRYPYKKKEQIVTSPILFIIAKEVFITITKEKFTLLDPFIKKERFFTTQKNKLLLQLFKIINTTFNTHFNTISRQVRVSSYELEKISNAQIIQFVVYERILNDFYMALMRTNTMLKDLQNHHLITFFDEDKDLIDDLFLSNDQLIQMSNENLKSIVNIRDAYSTIMTNNTNQVVRFFTSVTVILTIPTIIASIFGMNVGLPYQNHPLAFTGVIVFIMILVAVLVMLFLKKEWL
ncbi:MAG: magnesium transporter CorA family protein [Weeksellaceae bacterium]